MKLYLSPKITAMIEEVRKKGCLKIGLAKLTKRLNRRLNLYTNQLVTFLERNTLIGGIVGVVTLVLEICRKNHKKIFSYNCSPSIGQNKHRVRTSAYCKARH